ncbi:MAG: Cna B-type domain-containing protein, partial [Firmicutes bacterium]|nr:Cna B-type domain-containing protein [Bacillota bacterium]
MKKFLSIILALAMVFTFCGVFQPDGVIADDEPETPVLEKPIHVTVVDELGNPVTGARVVAKDAAGNTYEDEGLMEEVFIAFLQQGSYTLELSEIPEGYIADVREKTIEVALAEGEEIDNIKAKTIVAPYPDYSNLCSHNPSRMEVYRIVDSRKEIPGYCFNQNYDAPDFDDSGCTYTRLVGSAWLLGYVAQNERQGMSSADLYNHVLSMIYHRDDIKAKYGFDDFLTDYILNMAIKNLTDGDMDSFKTYDDDGNPMLIRDENGRPLLNDKGHYQFYPGGSTLGSIVAHAKNDHKTDPDYVFPEDVKNAWKEFVAMTDHPSDYFLYIYVPDNFVTKEYGIASGNFTVDNHYDNLYYADAFQALMSTFTVTPIKEQFVLRKTTDIIVTKVWEDNDNENQIRPSAEEYANYVSLYANGEDVTATYEDNRTVTDNQNGTYTVSFSNLPLNDDEKAAITYTIKESPVRGYTADQTEVANGGTITNTLTPEPETVDIPVTKTWVDDNNKEGKRPASITVNLLADGSTVETVQITPDKEGNWAYTFTELPKYQQDGKTEIAYTVTEQPVAGYTATIEGFKITNTKDVTPKTGDEMNLTLWVGMMLAAAAAV